MHFERSKWKERIASLQRLSLQEFHLFSSLTTTTKALEYGAELKMAETGPVIVLHAYSLHLKGNHTCLLYLVHAICRHFMGRGTNVAVLQSLSMINKSIQGIYKTQLFTLLNGAPHNQKSKVGLFRTRINHLWWIALDQVFYDAFWVFASQSLHRIWKVFL